jgi:hypothetical protein
MSPRGRSRPGLAWARSRGDTWLPRRVPLLLLGALTAAALLLPSAAAASTGVQNANPYWFEDTYQGAAYVDPLSTSAIVDTAGTGTAYLPPLSADDLAYAPAWVGADILEVGTAGGVQGWGFDGAGMVRETFLDVPVAQPAGVAFLGEPSPGQPGQGVALAVGTAAGVSVWAWTGQVWAQALSVSDPGVVGVAPGAEGGFLAATATGFALYSPSGQALAGVSGLAGLRGVAATDDGSIAAVWTGAAASFYAWTGAAYVPLPAWSEPAPSGGTLLGVAFFRDGTGYWLVTPAQAAAYGWNGAALAPLPAWDTSALPSLAVAASPGWEQGSLALLSPAGIAYLSAAGGALGSDAAESITGQSWSVFAPAAQVQSTVLPGLGHAVDEVKMVDTMAALPSGSSLAYWVSTDGGATWTDTPPLQPTAVPAGSSLVYRAALGTADQSQTPILDTTDLYEIATQVTNETQAVSWLLG